MSLKAGTQLGSYAILGAIGAGGMGEVYRARDTKLDRDVAIKVLPDSFAIDADRVARFTREAKTLAALNHPNIASIYGIEESGDTRALVMELVEGDDLSRIIARGPMALADALQVARQVAEALDTAHEQGIVHRDLKPANIKVRPDGTVKVLDFGLAKAATAADASSTGLSNSPTLTARATQLGMIIGTAAYMSPEQAKGRAIDKRSDIWAFGVVFYEMLTGRRGYEGEDVSDTLAAVLMREVDWTKLPAAAPPRLVGLLHDCLVRDPKQRLRDMGEARRIIEQIIAGVSSSSIVAPASVVGTAGVPAAVPRRSALPWAIAAIATIVAGVAVWRALAVTPPAAPPVTRARQSFQEVTGLVTISRDGRKLVYTSAGGPLGFRAELRDMSEFEGRPIPGADGGIIAIFSPAADWIAFSGTDNKIKKLPASGGTPLTLADGSFSNGAAWGDDDTIVYAGPAGLMRMAASGGTPAPLTTLDKTKNEVRHLRPQFLPGGRQLLFTVNHATGDPQFAVLDLQRGTYQTVARSGDNGQYVASGHLLSVRGSTLFAQPFDLARLVTTGTEAPVIERVSTIGPSVGTADYTVSADGLLVYSEAGSLGGTRLTWRDRKGADTPLAGQVARAWGTGHLSPDGHVVANGIAADNGSDIWVVDLSRGNPTRLTFGGANDNPVWLPDGRSLIYTGTKDGKPGLYRVSADGSGPPSLVLEGTGLTPSSVAADGKTLLFDAPSPATNRRHVMVLTLGSDAAPHTLRESAGADSDAQFSPDGHAVALVSSESGRVEVYVVPFPGPGPKVQISDHGGSRPRWASSGKELFFWDAGGGSSGLYGVPVQSAPFSVGTPTLLFSMFSGTTWGVAPDGQHFLVESVANGAVLATVTNWFEELRRRAPPKK